MSQPSSQKKILIIAIVAVVAAIGAGVVFTLKRGQKPDEPSYQGKPLSAWLKQMEAETESARDEAQAAVRAMGTNTLPLLFAKLRTPNAALGQRSTASEQQAVAIGAFQALGNKAAPAIPGLLEIIQSDQDLAPIAELVLIAVGEPSVAPLKAALASGNDRLKVHAAGALWSLKAEAQLVMPPLVKALKSPDDDVRAYAAVYLANLGQSPDKIVPALVENLADPKPSVRVATVQALTKIGKAAAAAGPALEKLKGDADESVRSEVEKALKKIGGGR